MSNTRSLAEAMGRNVPTEGVNNVQQHSFGTYLTLFGISLTYRYPDVSDLGLIDDTEIRNVAQFSLACTTIALETWGVVNVPQRRPISRSA